MQDAGIHSEVERLKATVDNALMYSNGADIQIAFFGGSFTGIEPNRMTALLEESYRYIKTGKVKGIRLSTRPDYIDSGIIAKLLYYGVTNIELGMQSTDNDVLTASDRGHDREACFKAARLITESGIVLGGQMMVGLPLSDAEKELQTARDIVKMGAKEARIYPTVVFRGTELFNMTENGEYIPISNEEAVERSAACLQVFRDNAVKVLRIGLHASQELGEVPYGANHPSIGEMVYSRLAFNDIVRAIGENNIKGKTLCIYVPHGTQSIVAGQNAENKRKLTEKYMCKRIRIFGCYVNKINVKIEAEG